MTSAELFRVYSHGLPLGQNMEQDDTHSVSDLMSELAAREGGYEIGLEREPNNPVALEG